VDQGRHVAGAKCGQFGGISEKSAASAKYLKNSRRRMLLVNDLLQNRLPPCPAEFIDQRFVI
jgi:hypothetical protein